MKIIINIQRHQFDQDDVWLVLSWQTTLLFLDNLI